MKFRSSILLLFVSFIFLSCNGQSTENVKIVDAFAFAEKIKKTPNPQILDVRTPEEFESEHIKNAKNLNWQADNFASDAEKYNKSKAVFVYCRSGGRSRKATEKLKELCFKNIYELEGGFIKWNAAGLNEPSKQK
jgi:rhodanese-related sulfurtransferase